MVSQLSISAVLLAIVSLASASCQLSNSASGSSKPETQKQLCVPQGKGMWTFSLYTTEVGVPTFSGEDAMAGVTGDSGFKIYDEACNLKGSYAPSGNNCGTPFVIMENFLPDVLTISSINMGLGSGAFSFNYGNGKYSTKNNHCGCQNMNSGLRGGQGCKCAFAQSGMLPKVRRELNA